MNEYNCYRAITNNDPYPHQVDTYNAIKEGQSVILGAPTGSGKSEAVCVPLSQLGRKVLRKTV